MFLNNAIIFILIGAAIAFIVYIFMRNDSNSVVKLNKDGRTYTVDQMTKFIKARMDEITRTNLYDIGLSEEELRRRKNKKYELKKALKGCTYGDVNDKKYVKELIFDLLHREYGVNQVNITSAIDFDNIEKMTTIDKFDILKDKVDSIILINIKDKLLYGKSYIKEEINGMKFIISYNSTYAF